MTRRFPTALTVVLLVAVAFLAAFAEGSRSSAAAGEPVPLVAQGDPAVGATVYSEKCASCHQANGAGVPGSFPPLLGNPNAADPAYVEDVVANGLSGPIEVLGEPYDAEMPAVELSGDELAGVAAYVGSLAETDPTAEPETPEVEVEPGDVDEGHALFTGSTRLENGAAACASCHTAGNVGNLGGSSLGPDLTDTLETFGGEAGLAAWLASPASATMKPIFDRNPITEAEIADVVVFLGDAPDQSKPSEPVDGLMVAGAVGFVILIGGMAIAWRGMRQTYFERLRSKR